MSSNAPPTLIATDGDHIRALGEPKGDGPHGAIKRLEHALRRATIIGFGNRGGPVLRMSREYATECDGGFVEPPSLLSPTGVTYNCVSGLVGFFRGVPVWIDEGSNCVVVDFKERV